MTQLLSPPRPVATRGRRMVAPGAVIGGLALATLALHLRDPHTEGSWGFCPSAALGFYCPGCGGLRAVNDLTHGQIGDALSSNLMVTLLIPFAVLGLAVWAIDRWRGRRRHVPMRVAARLAYSLLVVMVAFTLLRNLSVGDWLAP